MCRTVFFTRAVSSYELEPRPGGFPNPPLPTLPRYFPEKTTGAGSRCAVRIDQQWLVIRERQLPLKAATAARLDKRHGRMSCPNGNDVAGAPARHLQSDLAALDLGIEGTQLIDRQAVRRRLVGNRSQGNQQSE